MFLRCCGDDDLVVGRELFAPLEGAGLQVGSDADFRDAQDHLRSRSRPPVQPARLRCVDSGSGPAGARPTRRSITPAGGYEPSGGAVSNPQATCPRRRAKFWILACGRAAWPTYLPRWGCRLERPVGC